MSIHISTTSGYEDERKEGGSTEEQDDKGKKEEGKPKELNRSKFGKYVGKIGKDLHKYFTEYFIRLI